MTSVMVLPSGETPLLPSQVQSAEERASHEGYIHRVLVAFDDFWNVVGFPLLSPGKPDETISAHTRRIVDDPHAKHKFLAVVLNHALNVVQKNHGALAEAGDAARAKDVLQTEDQALGTTTEKH